LISSHPENALRGLDLVTSAPPRNKGAREGRVERVDRHGVVQHPAHPGRCHRPAVGAAIFVEPGSHLSISLAEPIGRNTDPDADGESPFSHRDYFARVTWHPFVPHLFFDKMASAVRNVQPLGLPRHEGYSRLTRGRMAEFLAARGCGAERGVARARGSR